MEDDEIEKEKAKLHPESIRFMDTMMAMYTDSQLERVAQSWVFIDNGIRRKRLEQVIELSVELGKIREIDIFGTGLGASLIERLIEGDLKGVRELADDQRFEGESDELKARYVPIWEKFNAMAMAAATPPENMQ